MSELAQKLIEENLQTKNPVLDLGNCGLDGTEDELYKPLADADHLEKLVLSDEWNEYDNERAKKERKNTQNSGKENRLIQIPAFLPKSLKTLILTGERFFGKINDISALSNLYQLQTLDISRNHIQNITPLKDLHQLQTLDISSNQNLDFSILKTLKQLQTLNLSRNEVREKDLSFLKDLHQLQTLDLSKNQIQYISILKDLKQLQNLNLGGNPIKDISFLEDLKQLIILDLSYISREQIHNFSILKNLKQLQSLNLRDNPIQDISFLEDLKHLQSLNLEYNPLQEISLEGFEKLTEIYLFENPLKSIQLKNLTSLKNLNLSDLRLNKVELINLPELQNLNLRKNQIQDISFLEGLKHLQSLYLGYNPLREISLEGFEKLTLIEFYETQLESIQLKNFTSLKKLDLSTLRLNKVELKNLPELQSLNLSENQITEISLEDFEKLTNIDLNSNPLESIQLKNFTSLKKLKLSTRNRKLNKVELKNLPELQSLELANNQIQDISFLKDLRQLQTLNLSENQIQDISIIKGLSQLQMLNLDRNQIQEFTLDFLNVFSKLETLKLYNNPIQNILKEIFDKWENVLPGVRRYLEDSSKGTTQNNEVKVILIGNGSVGKTQIAKRLSEKEHFVFDAQHYSTHAISLLRCTIDCNFTPDGLLLNLWDFGGQDIYHATHRPFMKTRALFLLVWDLENENKEYHLWEGRKYKNESLRYWLEYATFFGDNSPILVIQNKVDEEKQETFGIPVPEQEILKKEFPNIVEFWQLSAKTGFNFDELEYFISEVFEKNDTFRQDLIKRKLPIEWVKVRDKVRIEQAKENGLKQITIDTFHAWCKEAGVEDSTSTILQFFHDTSVLYYQEKYFSGKIILDQAWAVKAIYKILDRQGNYFKILQKRKGYLNYKEIDEIWKENTDKERELFIKLMLSAELCFEIIEKSSIYQYKELKDRFFVIPQLLREDKPDYISLYEAYNGLDQEIKIPYRFLPSVFIHRFIIKAKDFAEVKDMWQSGIYLHYQRQYATVEADYKVSKIIIRYNAGADKLVSAIQDELEAINKNIPVKALQGEMDFMGKYLRKGFERLRAEGKFESDNHPNMKKGINIFVSYSSKDRELRELLVEGLQGHLHHRKGYEYNTWTDAQIDLGANWEEEIEKALEDCNAALLLVSATFASSKFINEKELAAFFKKKKEKGFLIMPVLVRKYDFKHFEELSSLNFFKTYYPEYGFNKPIDRHKLLHFDKLADDDNTPDRKLNDYYHNLADFIHTAVENHFEK